MSWTTFDSINLGMREFLKEVETKTEDLTEEWIQEKEGRYGTKVVSDRVQVWRALKSLTTGEARKAIMSIKTEDGFKALQKLHMHLGPSLASRQGMVLAELSGMVAKLAKTPGETRSLLMELERRVKVAEDVTVESISDMHSKSILVGILDPVTRQHTAMHRGTRASYDQLKRVVLEFVNNMARVDDAMQVGMIGETAEAGDETQGEDLEHFFVGAVGKGQQCFNCQGFGHLARECPSKGKGKNGDKGFGEKGKGKGSQTYGPIKGAGKSKGKGPMYGGCWTCGGSHYQSECPRGQGQGQAGSQAVHGGRGHVAVDRFRVGRGGQIGVVLEGARPPEPP